ncbi:hypothetical protein ASPWEDRAFT_38665 [Aspergillus wentii DTO 134E9]|uniref:Hydrophobin n=1 Tax=Aspergillus wentii DTO 134E9 TaxID=1073089 RepID=A0A1L9RQ17_ASPWE|nr:uncharacterized protein ASPWEDRAFT_38665 [Aspergillus wentii DTO 134E9]KAI9928478.1 hypothetical protein MW887_002523 [Aspergillus wentii]OJJ37031.1 hypothetical protein ASPWEDRAFT_38665 [Aspergillus wentii DTO 134E9]
MRFTPILMFAAFAAASPLTARDSPCDQKSFQCCSQVVNPSSPAASALIGLLGISAPTSGEVGLTCSPLSGTGDSCDQKPVCCDDNSYNGIIALGCTSASA